MFFSRFRNPKLPERASQLNTCLEDYPVFPVPAKGQPLSFTAEQSQANLDAFVKAIPDRLLALRTLCEHFAIQWPDNLSLEHSKELIIQLHALAGDTWRYALKVPSKETTQSLWFAGKRDGEYKILSLVSDIALLLGTIIIHERSVIRWGIDTDKKNLKDRMGSVNRVVLLAPWRGDSDAVTPVDVEWVVLGRLTKPDDTSQRFENNWLGLVEDASRGAYEGIGVVDL